MLIMLLNKMSLKNEKKSVIACYQNGWAGIPLHATKHMQNKPGPCKLNLTDVF